MADELAFFEKAQATRDLHRKASAEGWKLGRLQDMGIFLGPDAPASLVSDLMPLLTPAEWQARMDGQFEDPIYQKFGPGMTIMNLYHNPAKGADAVPGDTPSPRMMEATQEEIDRLWTEYFRNYPNPLYRVGIKLFLAAVREEAARRCIM